MGIFLGAPKKTMSLARFLTKRKKIDIIIIKTEIYK